MVRARGSFVLSLALALSLALLRVSNASLLKHREVTPQLPEDDNRVRRNPNSGPHTPEQVHLSYAGPGAVTVSWVTWPQEDPEFHDASVSAQAGTASLTASRKLKLSVRPREWANVGRHHHRHHHRRDEDLDDDQSGHCERLRSFGVGSAVQWGVSPGDYLHTIQGSTDCYSTTVFDSGALHHVVIGQDEGPLPPGSKIYYRVGDVDTGEWSDELSFTSAPPLGPASLPYRIGLLGDLGQTEHSASTLEHLAEQNADSVMFVGDLSYADGFQPRWDTWGRLVGPYASSTVWMYTEGNHEIEPSNNAPDFLAYTKRFRVPFAASASPSPLYYSYDVAGVHIIMLGSYDDYSRSSPQMEWLRNDLAGVDRGRTPWVVAAMHAPWYNSNYNHYGEGEDMRQSMESVLYEHGVDAVIAGHVHAYERSVPTFNSKPDECGPHYLNIGDGGNREGLDFDYYKQPDWSAFREPSYGHGVIDFLNETHAAFAWHRNQDGVAEVADETILVRDPECRTGGAARLAAKMR